MPRGAKNALRLRLLLDERDKPPTLITSFEERSVLVVAPHMDDEVIGCGGSLRRHVLAGSPVTVVFMTDGRIGSREIRDNRSLGGQARARAETELAEQRKRESARAAEILGLGELVFLDAPDGQLDDTPHMVDRLGEVLRRTRPSVVYLPSMLDLHDDHWAANRVFRRCLDSIPPSDEPLVLREYEVWTPLLVNRLTIIDDVIEEKRRALEEYASQNPRRLVNVSTGLNRYRSVYLFRDRERDYAEAFFESTPEQYRVLFDRFTERR